AFTYPDLGKVGMAGTPTPPTSRGRPDVEAARALYSRHADDYDLLTHWAAEDRARVVNLLDLQPGDAVVDVGCGTGLCFAEILDRIGPTGRLVGVEPSVDMLGRAGERVARAGWRNVDLRLGLAEERLRADDTFDAALFCFTHDVLRSRPALETVVSSLRPSGRVAAVGPLVGAGHEPAHLVRHQQLRDDLRRLLRALEPPAGPGPGPGGRAPPPIRRVLRLGPDLTGPASGPAGTGGRSRARGSG